MTVLHWSKPLSWPTAKRSMLSCRDGTPLKAFLVQVAVLLNHQNGRDTHLRQIRIFGPRELPTLCTDTLDNLSPEFAMYSCIR